MSKLTNILQPVFTGILIVLAGTIPRNIIFEANLRYYSDIPWGVPIIAIYIWFFWHYLDGGNANSTESLERRQLMPFRVAYG